MDTAAQLATDLLRTMTTRDTPSGEHTMTLRFMAAPTDVATLGGNVRGGKILEWIDQAAYACAAAWSGRYAVTAYVGDIRFTRDILSGDVVEVTAAVVYTGRSTMHIRCEVRSARPHDGAFTDVSSCLMVFVAMDAGGPVPVRRWTPRNVHEQDAADDARRRITVRKRIEAEMDSVQYSASGTLAERATTRFLAAPTDVNWGGNAHGGRVMGWIDDAAYLCATRWCTGEAVTVYVGGTRFYRPIHIGDVVEIESRLIHTGRQTMHMSIHVYAGTPHHGDLQLTTHSLNILAALDDHGTATAVRRWTPWTSEDVALDQHAVTIARLRTGTHHHAYATVTAGQQDYSRR